MYLHGGCVALPCGLCGVCVGFAWGFHSMYGSFTVCLIICYRNSGTLRVRVQGTYSASAVNSF